MVWGLVAFTLTLAFGMWRNIRVFKYRGELLALLSAAAKDDAEKGKQWMWRYEYYDTCTYNEMMFKFWKPLSSFYTNRTFIEKRKK